MIISRISSRRRSLTAVYFIDVPDMHEWRELMNFQTPESVRKKKGVEESAANDDFFLLFDSDTLSKSNFEQNRTVSVSEVGKLLFLSGQNRAKSRAIYYLARQDYTKKALKDKLTRDFGTVFAESAAEYAVENGYINDEALAERLFESMTSSNISKNQAVYKLIQKGVSRETAKNIAADIEVDAKAQLKELINRKYRYAIRGEDKDVRRAVNALLRRGFSYSDIKSVLSGFDTELMYEDD